MLRLIALAFTTLVWAAMAVAQVDPDVQELVDTGREALKAKDSETARSLFQSAIDLGETSDDPATQMAGYAAMAERFMREFNHEKGIEFADWVLSKLDSDLHVLDDPYLRALMVKGVALRSRKLQQEAELTLELLHASVSLLPREKQQTFLYGLSSYAALLFELDRPEAPQVASNVRSLWEPTQEVHPALFSRLLYMEAQHLWTTSTSADVAAERIWSAVEIATLANTIPDADAMDIALVQNQVAQLYKTAEETEAALYWARSAEALFETARADNPKYRTGGFATGYLQNGHILTSLEGEQGRLENAIGLAQRYRDLALGAEPANHYVAAIFEEMLGSFYASASKPALSQQHYRTAYATIRLERPVTDPVVVRMGDKVKRNDPGFATFALAHELGGELADPELVADGAGVLKHFLSGLDLSVGPIPLAMEQDPLFWLNRSLALALTGHQGQMIDTLERARTLGAESPESGVNPASPWFDLIEALGTGWATDHRRQDAEPALARLRARSDEITAEENRLYLALESFVLSTISYSRAELSFRAWQTSFEGVFEPTDWDLFGACIALAIGQQFLTKTEADQISSDLTEWLDARPGLQLLRDYLTVNRANPGQAAVGSVEELIILAATVKRLASGLREPANLVAFSRVNLGYALETWGDFDAALLEYQAATEFYRNGPHPSTNTIAFLLAGQSNTLRQLGEAERAKVVAKQAFSLAIGEADQSLDSIAYAVMAYSSSLAREGRYQEAIDVLETHLSENGGERRFNDLPWKVSVAMELAGYYDSMGEQSRAIEILLGVESIVSAMRGHRNDQWVNYMTSRSYVQFRRGALHASFEDINAANRAHFLSQRDRASGSVTGSVAASDYGRERVAAEAFIAWEYAQTLETGR